MQSHSLTCKLPVLSLIWLDLRNHFSQILLPLPNTVSYEPRRQTVYLKLNADKKWIDFNMHYPGTDAALQIY